jgi:Xaa-Pro aminopeptidase
VTAGRTKAPEIRKVLREWKLKERQIPFPQREFDLRLARLRTAMAKNGLDVVFLSSPESIYYLSGYSNEWYQAQGSQDWYPASGIAVHRDRDDFVLFEVEDEYLLVRHTSVAKDIRAFRLDSENWSGMPKWIVSNLKEDRWLPANIGLEMWSYRPHRGVSEIFQKLLEREGCRVVDCTALLRDLRRVKSPLELECMEQAAKIAKIGIRAFQDAVQPGVTELQVWGEAMRAMAAAGGENPSISVPVVSGPRSALIHALASRRKIRKGDLVGTDLCGVYNRYHVNVARTVSVGKPDPEVDRTVRLAAGAFDVLEDLIEPNLPVRRLLATMNAYYAKVGIADRMWFWGGYELGLSFSPDWVGQFVYEPMKEPGDSRFVPGMIVNYEGIAYLPKDAGVSAIIDSIAFEKSGARMLCADVPFELAQV